MFILHLALGGCLKSPPVHYGITADTGGHIAYILDAAAAQAMNIDTHQVSIVTRLFEEPGLPLDHARATERLSPKLTIDRIATANRRYLEKDALADDLAAFTESFCAHLARLPRLPDVIHAHFSDAAAVAAEARRRFAIPFVYTPHALGIDKRRHHGPSPALDGRIAAERTAIASADALIVSTEDEAQRQVQAYGIPAGGRIHRIAPGVPNHEGGRPDGPTLADRLDEWLDDPAKPIILAIARPVAKKNLGALARAYAASAKLREAANLVILAGHHDGPGSAEERAVLAELLALADTAALRGRIALPPRHDGDDVAALYERAATGGVFVNAALHEPFGLTLIEAAAAGVPVVATRHGGPSEIVAALDHGLLVEPRDEDAIATACLSILSDPDTHKRMSANGRSGSTLYAWDRYAMESTALYAHLPRTPGLLASDIDHTLTGCRVGAHDFAAWRQASDLPFVVATGRSFAMARIILSQWGIPEPDAFITDVGTRIMLKGQRGWQECPEFATRLNEGWDRKAVVAALKPLRLRPQPRDTAGPHKVSYFGTAEDAARVRETLAEQGLSAKTVFSHGRLIDVLAPLGGKAAAVAAYAKRLDLPMGACVAAGDSGNDVDMLDACGHAIVVGNAGHELADLPERDGLMRVTAHHANGVMEGLERLGLTAPMPTQATAA
ncbi:HAD-IIB family hydrolase [Sphingomonas parapaucimobilis]|uniref:HAD-IIB family hydrolase n=1 Tax=Sphingomonas parapaucimobilis TaxID=28213 RepID=UPI0035C81767